jgi:hypothetical protein
MEWSDDADGVLRGRPVDVNRMTTPPNMRWMLIDRETGAENAEIDWRFRVGDQVNTTRQLRACSTASRSLAGAATSSISSSSARRFVACAGSQSATRRALSRRSAPRGHRSRASRPRRGREQFAGSS